MDNDSYYFVNYDPQVNMCGLHVEGALDVLPLALIQEIRALYWLKTLFAVKFQNCFITMIYN